MMLITPTMDHLRLYSLPRLLLESWPGTPHPPLPLHTTQLVADQAAGTETHQKTQQSDEFDDQMIEELLSCHHPCRPQSCGGHAQQLRPCTATSAQLWRTGRSAPGCARRKDIACCCGYKGFFLFVWQLRSSSIAAGEVRYALQQSALLFSSRSTTPHCSRDKTTAIQPASSD